MLPCRPILGPGSDECRGIEHAVSYLLLRWITAEVSRPGAKLAFAESEPKGKNVSVLRRERFFPLSQVGAPGNFICRQTDAADWVPGSVVEEGLRY
jgi:hypothetical protein